MDENATLNTVGTERKTDRLEAFSDAVLAIAITLPIVDLKAPEFDPDRLLSSQYAGLHAQYASYAMSFVVIGLYWAYSHFSGKLWRKTDHGFNLLTLVFLACVSVTSFPTKPLVEHWHDPSDGRTAAVVYAWMLVAPAVAWMVRWLYGVRRGLLDPHLALDYVGAITRRYLLISGGCVAGALIATAIDWHVGLAVVAICTLVNVLPPLRPRYKPGEAPREDIEEADEKPA